MASTNGTKEYVPMSEGEVREILEKQLKFLARCSRSKKATPHNIGTMTEKMLMVADWLYPFRH